MWTRILQQEQSKTVSPTAKDLKDGDRKNAEGHTTTRNCACKQFLHSVAVAHMKA